MKKILAVFFASWLAASAVAQSPRLLVNGYETDLRHFISSGSAIDSMQVFRNDSTNSEREPGRNQSVTIFTKPGVEFLTWQQIAEKYRLSPKQRTLRPCINQVLARNPELIYIEAALIESVAPTTERAWVNAEDAFSQEEFINVKLKTTHSSSRGTLRQSQPQH